MQLVRWNELLFLVLDRIKDAVAPYQFMPSGVGANSENIRISSGRAIQSTEDALEASNGTPCVLVSWLGNSSKTADYQPLADCDRINQYISVYCIVDAGSSTDTANADSRAGYLCSAVMWALNNWNCIPTNAPPRTTTPFTTLKLHSEQRTVYPSGNKKTLCYHFIFQSSIAVKNATSKLT